MRCCMSVGACLSQLHMSLFYRCDFEYSHNGIKNRHNNSCNDRYGQHIFVIILQPMHEESSSGTILKQNTEADLGMYCHRLN